MVENLGEFRHVPQSLDLRNEILALGRDAGLPVLVLHLRLIMIDDRPRFFAHVIRDVGLWKLSVKK